MLSFYLTTKWIALNVRRCNFIAYFHYSVKMDTIFILVVYCKPRAGVKSVRNVEPKVRYRFLWLSTHLAFLLYKILPVAIDLVITS